MADLTWYSREGADQRFLTKGEASGLATKTESTQGDAALSGRIDAVKETAEAALPSATAASTYATKAEVEAVKQSVPQPSPAPDLSGYATKTEVQASDTALGQRIDTVSAVASAAAPRTELAQYATTDAVAATYATKESLAGYLRSEDAESTYATKTALAQAQLGGGGGGQAPDLSGLATKAEVRQADSALGARIDGVKATAEAALPKAEATTKYATKTDLAAYATSTSVSSTYATKEALTTATAPIASLTSKVSSLETAVGGKADASALSSLLPKAEASTTYATKADVASVRAAIPAAPDLSDYLTRSAAEGEFVTNENLQRELGQKAGVVELNDVSHRVDALGSALSPFKPGERYYSPVTYFWPDYYDDGKPGKTSKWAQILKFAGSLGIVILNRNSGNWDEFNVDFKKQATLALAAGAKRAVFYVKTQYLAATLPAGDPGRDNVPNVDKYTPDYILGQIDKAKTQYGDVCQGVFLDEAINGWGAQAGRIPAYKSLIDKIRAKYGKDYYAAVTWNNAPDGKRYQVGWMSNWAYVRDLPTTTWRTAMSTVREMGLTRVDGKLRLTAQPVTALDSLRTGQELTRKDADIPAGDTSLGQAAQGTSLDISVDLSPDTSSFAGLKVLDNGEQYTLVGYDAKAKQLVVDRTHSGVTDFSPKFPDRATAPLSPDSKGQVHLRIVVDAHSVEVFAADGTPVITETVYPKQGATNVSLHAEGGTARLSSLSLWHLGAAKDAGGAAEGPDSPGPGQPAVQRQRHGQDGAQAVAQTASASPVPAAAGRGRSGGFPLARTGTSLTLGVLGAAAAAIGAYVLRLRRRQA